MRITITDQAVAKLGTCPAQGPLRVSRIKLADHATHYTPTTSQTGLLGTVVYDADIDGCRVIAPGQVEFLKIIPETEGNWQFREVGLYLDDGTLFGIGVLDGDCQAEKRKQDLPNDQLGNRYIIRAQVLFSNIATCLDFTLYNDKLNEEWANDWTPATGVNVSTDKFRITEDAKQRITESNDYRITEDAVPYQYYKHVAIVGDVTERFHQGRRLRVSSGTVSEIVYTNILDAAYDSASDMTILEVYDNIIPGGALLVDYGILSTNDHHGFPLHAIEIRPKLLLADMVVPQDTYAKAWGPLAIDDGVALVVRNNATLKIEAF